MKVEDGNRCGEIYRIGPEIFAFSCTVCNEFFSTTKSVLDHIETHFLENFADCDNFDHEKVDFLTDSITADTDFAIESDIACADDTLGLKQELLLNTIQHSSVDAETLLNNEQLKHESTTIVTNVFDIWPPVLPLKTPQHENSDGLSARNTNEIICDIKENIKEIVKTSGKKTRKGKSLKISAAARGKEPTTCHICAKILRTDSLKDHLESHSQELKYSCNVCDKKFNTRLNLRNHKYSHREVKVKYHTKRVQVICHFCGCTFAAKSLLRAHIVRRHIDYKPFVCEICDKSFAHPTILRTHLRTHSDEKPFKCKLCENIAFKIKPGLDRHMRKVHNAEKPHKCKECPNTFMDRRSLVEHIRSHTGEKPYRCEICYNSFSRKPIYTEHMQLHSGLKKYKCNYCDKTFAQRSTCYSHQRTIHKKIPRKQSAGRGTEIC